MAVDISTIISRAFQTVIKNPVLWLLGFLVALLGYASGNNNLSISDNNRVRFFNIDTTFDTGTLALVGLVLFIVAIAFFILRAAFEAGLIAAGDRVMKNETPTMAEAWRDGKAGMWAIVGLNLIFAAFIIALVVAVALLAGITIAGAVFAGMLGAQSVSQAPEVWGTVAGVGWGILVAIILVLLAIPVGIALGVTTQLGQRAAVLDKQRIGQAWSTGWSLMRSHLGSVIGLLLLQFLINLVIGAVALAIVAPIVAIPAIAGGTTFNEVTVGTVTAAVIIIGIAWLVSSLVMAIPQAWNSMLWTAFYRAATVGLPELTPSSRTIGGQLPPTVPRGMGR